MSTVLIQNGTIVNADLTVKADLLIEGTTIKEIRADLLGQRIRLAQSRRPPRLHL